MIDDNMNQIMERPTKKELEIQGCRTFVCPNLSLIDEKGKELGLKEETIKKAKELAVRYFKETYHRPHYSSAKHVLPAFLYIASILESERRYQSRVADVFGTSHSTVRKWYKDVINTLCLNIKYDDNESTRVLNKYGEFIYPDLDLIEEGGKILGLKKGTTERAKNLAVRYFKVIYYKPNYPPATKTVMPSLLYLAGVIENDRRTQMDISTVFNVAEPVISAWHRDILDALGMKIIYGENRRVLKIIERQD